MANDRIFVSTSSMAESVAVSWAVADNGITSRGDRPDYDGELLVFLDGISTIKWWSNDEECYVLVIDPMRRNGSYATIYRSEDQPPDASAEVVWSDSGKGV